MVGTVYCLRIIIITNEMYSITLRPWNSMKDSVRKEGGWDGEGRENSNGALDRGGGMVVELYTC